MKFFFTPSEFIEKYTEIGYQKANNKVIRLLLLSILSGIFLGFAAAGSTVASALIENPSIKKIISGLIFPAGLIMIILTGAELFTGNCLISISVFSGKTKLTGLLRNLLIVYIGNFLGSILISFIIVTQTQYLQIFPNGELITEVCKIANTKCSITFFNGLFSGFCCNILVCAAVSMSVCATEIPGKILASTVPVALFVICGFEHSIANMYYIPAGLFIEMFNDSISDFSNLTVANFFVKNLLPVTVGNILGGVAFSLLIYLPQSVKTKK